MTAGNRVDDDGVNPFHVDRRDLAEDDRLVRLWNECRRRNWVGSDHDGMLLVFECAQHALDQPARKPGALWVWTMKNGRQHVTDDEKRRAKARLAAWFEKGRPTVK